MARDKQAILLRFDTKMIFETSGFVAGVDEVGRGPLAGPVVAAAVLFIRPSRLKGLNDSKQVTPFNRERLFREIIKSALIGVGVVDHLQIDAINIYQATRLAMRMAILALTRTPDLVLIDGNLKLDLPLAQKAIIKGDQKSHSIAAASIIAKVHRDAFMQHMHLQYPQYGFDQHKGYATALHRKNIELYGPCPIHRRTFLSMSQEELSFEEAFTS